MPETRGQTNIGPERHTHGSEFADSGSGAGVSEKKPSQARAIRRRATMAFLLNELQNKSNPIPDTFISPQRALPSAPAPAILKRAVESCRTVFLDVSDVSKSVQDQRNSFLEALCRLADENQRFAVASYMSEFETRITESFPQLAAYEINASYKALEKLLACAPCERSMPWQSRLLAASQFLSHLANPETICLGTRLGAQIVCLIQKLCLGRPSSLADVLASACLVGEHKAFDGKIVAVDEHSLKPGAEELSYKPGDLRRSLAVKILQCMLLNNCLPRRSRPMIYSETPGRPGRGYGGQIVKTLDGELLNPKLGVNLSFLELALLSCYQFGEKQSVLVNDSSFSERSAERQDAVKQKHLRHVSSSSDLAEALRQARDKHMLPLTIAIDERRLLADTYKDGINHAINVIVYNDYGMLKIYNPQLLPGMQRIARVPLQKLYNATLSVP